MISKSKQTVTLAIEKDRVKELKKKAIDAGLSLSEFMSAAGMGTSVVEAQKIVSSGGVLPQK